jgi:hypothetical protein
MNQADRQLCAARQNDRIVMGFGAVSVIVALIAAACLYCAWGMP